MTTLINLLIFCPSSVAYISARPCCEIETVMLVLAKVRSSCKMVRSYRNCRLIPPTVYPKYFYRLNLPLSITLLRFDSFKCFLTFKLVSEIDVNQ